MGRPMDPMNAKIESFIRMEARGEDHAAVLLEIFGIGPDADPKEKHNAECTMHRWRHRPDAQPIWDDEMKARVRRNVPRAVGRLEKQIDDEAPWVANKASNDYIALATKVGIFAGEEKAISVKIEGMPDIGSPDEGE